MIVIGLGSSMPDALSWLRRAVAALKQERAWRILSVSRVYQSDALLPPGAPASWNVPYLNLAVSLTPTPTPIAPLDPHTLLARLKQLEKALGRKPRERWAPREIDLDILIWEGHELASPELSIPHAGVWERPFALLPLEEVAPQWVEANSRARQQVLKWRTDQPDAVPFRTHPNLASLTELVAILNLTPDSFSDGGSLRDEDAIFNAAKNAVDAGATVLDLGAESTRPGASSVTPDDEWRRLEPALKLVQALRRDSRVRISLDSRHPDTVERALKADAIDWINDVGGFVNARMRSLAKESRAQLVFMHSLGVPPDRTITLPEGPGAPSPADAVLSWGHAQLKELEAAGIESHRLILDPGIGFGKTPAQNLALLREARKLHQLGIRVLIGHSRKSFLATLLNPSLKDTSREIETALLTAELASQGIEYLRVHDCATQARALRFRAAWDGFSRWS